MDDPTRIEAAILHLTGERGPDRSICPSEVARALEPDWQRLMTAVRRAAIRLAQAGRIDILRKGKPVEPADVKGVIRLRIRAQPPVTLRDGGASTPVVPAPRQAVDAPAARSMTGENALP